MKRRGAARGVTPRRSAPGERKPGVRSRKIESFASFSCGSTLSTMDQVYLFGGAMRFLARDQVSNVLASRGHGTVLSAVLPRREKKSLIRASARPTGSERPNFIFSSRRRRLRAGL